MPNNKIISYNFKGKYFYNGQSGTQTGKIYLNPEKSFIGSAIDSGKNFLMYGKLTDKKLSFFKIHEKMNYLPVFWVFDKTSELKYKGNFSFINSSIAQEKIMYNSLEKSLEFFKSGDFGMVGSIEKEMFKKLEGGLEELIKKFPRQYNSFGEIILEAIDFGE